MDDDYFQASDLYDDEGEIFVYIPVNERDDISLSDDENSQQHFLPVTQPLKNKHKNTTTRGSHDITNKIDISKNNHDDISDHPNLSQTGSHHSADSLSPVNQLLSILNRNIDNDQPLYDKILPMHHFYSAIAPNNYISFDHRMASPTNELLSLLSSSSSPNSPYPAYLSINTQSSSQYYQPGPAVYHFTSNLLYQSNFLDSSNHACQYPFIIQCALSLVTNPHITRCKIRNASSSLTLSPYFTHTYLLEKLYITDSLLLPQATPLHLIPALQSSIDNQTSPQQLYIPSAPRNNCIVSLESQPFQSASADYKSMLSQTKYATLIKHSQRQLNSILYRNSQQITTSREPIFGNTAATAITHLSNDNAKLPSQQNMISALSNTTTSHHICVISSINGFNLNEILANKMDQQRLKDFEKKDDTSSHITILFNSLLSNHNARSAQDLLLNYHNIASSNTPEDIISRYILNKTSSLDYDTHTPQKLQSIKSYLYWNQPWDSFVKYTLPDTLTNNTFSTNLFQFLWYIKLYGDNRSLMKKILIEHVLNFEIDLKNQDGGANMTKKSLEIDGNLLKVECILLLYKFYPVITKYFNLQSGNYIKKQDFCRILSTVYLFLMQNYDFNIIPSSSLPLSSQSAVIKPAGKFNENAINNNTNIDHSVIYPLLPIPRTYFFGSSQKSKQSSQPSLQTSIFNFPQSIWKSFLQKSIRHSVYHLSTAKIALQLGLKESFTEVIRRVSIIMVEDSILNPIFPYIMYIATLTSKKLSGPQPRLTQQTTSSNTNNHIDYSMFKLYHISIILTWLYEICKVNVRDPLPRKFYEEFYTNTTSLGENDISNTHHDQLYIDFSSKKDSSVLLTHTSVAFHLNKWYTSYIVINNYLLMRKITQQHSTPQNIQIELYYKHLVEKQSYFGLYDTINLLLHDISIIYQRAILDIGVFMKGVINNLITKTCLSDGCSFNTSLKHPENLDPSKHDYLVDLFTVLNYAIKPTDKADDNVAYIYTLHQKYKSNEQHLDHNSIVPFTTLSLLTPLQQFFGLSLQETHLVQSILIRYSFGGNASDVEMTLHYSYVWLLRFVIERFVLLFVQLCYLYQIVLKTSDEDYDDNSVNPFDTESFPLIHIKHNILHETLSRTAVLMYNLKKFSTIVNGAYINIFLPNPHQYQTWNASTDQSQRLNISKFFSSYQYNWIFFLHWIFDKKSYYSQYCDDQVKNDHYEYGMDINYNLSQSNSSSFTMSSLLQTIVNRKASTNTNCHNVMDDHASSPPDRNETVSNINNMIFRLPLDSSSYKSNIEDYSTYFLHTNTLDVTLPHNSNTVNENMDFFHIHTHFTVTSSKHKYLIDPFYFHPATSDTKQAHRNAPNNSISTSDLLLAGVDFHASDIIPDVLSKSIINMSEYSPFNEDIAISSTIDENNNVPKKSLFTPQQIALIRGVIKHQESSSFTLLQLFKLLLYPLYHPFAELTENVQKFEGNTENLFSSVTTQVVDARITNKTVIGIMKSIMWKWRSAVERRIPLIELDNPHGDDISSSGQNILNNGSLFYQNIIDIVYTTVVQASMSFKTTNTSSVDNITSLFNIDVFDTNPHLLSQLTSNIVVFCDKSDLNHDESQNIRIEPFDTMFKHSIACYNYFDQYNRHITLPIVNSSPSTNINPLTEASQKSKLTINSQQPNPFAQIDENDPNIVYNKHIATNSMSDNPHNNYNTKINIEYQLFNLVKKYWDDYSINFITSHTRETTNSKIQRNDDDLIYLRGVDFSPKC